MFASCFARSLCHISDLETLSSSWEAGRHCVWFSAILDKVLLMLNTKSSLQTLGHIAPKWYQTSYKGCLSQDQCVIPVSGDSAFFLRVKAILQERSTKTKYLRPNQIFPGTFIQVQTLVDLTPILTSCLACHSWQTKGFTHSPPNCKHDNMVPVQCNFFTFFSDGFGKEK